MVFGCPDVPNQWGLLEFKTFNKNNFAKLQKIGVQEAKHEYFVQVQQYMAERGLEFTLFGAVCKDDDELHLEIVRPDRINSGLYKKRALEIITAQKAPNRCSASPAYQTCKFCDGYEICHKGGKVLKTCRSCDKVVVSDNGEWFCSHKQKVLSADEQIAACESYQLSGMFE
jgi:hypothetical protein